jgi:hypothetical protein
MSEASCETCGHAWDDHYKNDGCYGGWEYNADGIAVNDGCRCLLAHSRYSFADPTRRSRHAESD